MNFDITAFRLNQKFANLAYYLKVQGAMDEKSLRVVCDKIRRIRFFRKQACIVEMSGVTDIDLFGVRELLMLASRCRTAGVALLILNPSSATEDFFEATGIKKFLRICRWSGKKSIDVAGT